MTTAFVLGGGGLLGALERAYTASASYLAALARS